MTEIVFKKNVYDVYFDFFLPHVPSANMEEADFMIYTATSHQMAIKTLWLHFGGAAMSPAFYKVDDHTHTCIKKLKLHYIGKVSYKQMLHFPAFTVQLFTY